MDNPVTVHDINELTVVTDESYTDFVAGLQKEIAESLSARPRKASVEVLHRQDASRPTTGDECRGDAAMAQAALQATWSRTTTSTTTTTITEAYQEAKDAGTLAALPAESEAASLIRSGQLVDALYIDAQLPKIDDGRKPKTNPAQRGELREEGVPGAVGPDQPQGRLPGRVRLRLS